MSFKLSNTSKRKLKTCHNDLQKIVVAAIAVSAIDFGVAEGHRSVIRQRKLYLDGKTKVDGINIKGKHNCSPSEAVDLYAFVNGKASWDREVLCYVAGVITAVAKQLKKQGEISHNIRWGGNWDGDGEILADQGFDDLPHFELKK